MQLSVCFIGTRAVVWRWPSSCFSSSLSLTLPTLVPTWMPTIIRVFPGCRCRHVQKPDAGVDGDNMQLMLLMSLIGRARLAVVYEKMSVGRRTRTFCSHGV